MSPPIHGRHARRGKKRRLAWDMFLQALLFAVTAAVIKHHYGVDLEWMP